jgi:hypothetical protein
MSSRSFEHTLARLYTDARFREAFLRDARSTLEPIELSETERAALARVDRAGLVLAAASYTFKRARSAGLLERVRRRLHR